MQHVESSEESSMQQVLRRRIRTAVLVSTCVSGAAALIYEVAWTRELSLVFGSTVYAVSTMLAAFMAGLSLGGYLGGRRADKEGARIVRDLALVELGIGIFGVLTIPLIRLLPVIYYWMQGTMSTPGWTFFAVQLLLSFLVMLVPTTLMGATFPIVSKVNTLSFVQVGRAVGNVYSINTLGSIFGSLSAGFLLIPLLGVKGAIITAAVLNIMVSVGLLVVARYSRWRQHAATALVLLFIVASVGVLTPDPAFTLGFATMVRYNSYAEYQEQESTTRVLYTDDNAYSRVTVTEGHGNARSLHNGGFIEGSNGLTDRATTNILALLPYAHAQNPRTGLVIGLGTGYTAEVMLDLPFESVDTVEINPAVLTASRFFVEDRLESNPRWHLYLDDARQFLQVKDRHYDVISSEPSWPLTESVAHLFTREFFQLTSDSLNDDGVFVQWLPRYLLDRETFMMVYRTFHDVFPASSAWTLTYDDKESGDLFLVGVKTDVPTRSVEEVRDSVHAQLKKRGLSQVVLGEMPSPVTLEQAVTDPSIPMNTDDRPQLEFRVVGNLVKQLEGTLTGK